jgi:uncharacterized membrane protein YdfJ with MMPL/SSD domain
VRHQLKSARAIGVSVIGSAAIVMVAVFAIFATLHSVDMKELGVGLAIAVLIDATLVRAVLLPATMTLLGDWNWYLPHRLQWLPSLSAEGAPVQAATHAPGVSPAAPAHGPQDRRSSSGTPCEH